MREITLEPPLEHLVKTCETICVAECCGVDAYDFSPFHAASYLIRYDNRIDVQQLEDMRRRLDELQVIAVQMEKDRERVSIPEMNQIFDARQMQNLVREVSDALQRAVELIEAEAKENRS